MQMRSVWLVLALALSPAAAAAQDGRDGRAVAEARVEAALQAAAERGIPVALLESRIGQGRARGVAMERIAAAVEARLDALTKARDAFARAQLESTTEGELALGGTALEAGVSERALITISETAPQERRMVAIAVLTDLVALGRASDEALAEVQAALARGPEGLANLRADAAAGLQSRGASGAAIPASAGARVDLSVRRPGS